MDNATIGRDGLYDLSKLLAAGAQNPAVNQIEVKSVCVNINPDATMTRVYRFDSPPTPPTKCPQCSGEVTTDPKMVVKPGCYWEKG